MRFAENGARRTKSEKSEKSENSEIGTGQNSRVGNRVGAEDTRADREGRRNRTGKMLGMKGEAETVCGVVPCINSCKLQSVSERERKREGETRTQVAGAFTNSSGVCNRCRTVGLIYDNKCRLGTASRLKVQLRVHLAEKHRPSEFVYLRFAERRRCVHSTYLRVVSLEIGTPRRRLALGGACLRLIFSSRIAPHSELYRNFYRTLYIPIC